MTPPRRPGRNVRHRPAEGAPQRVNDSPRFTLQILLNGKLEDFNLVLDLRYGCRNVVFVQPMEGDRNVARKYTKVTRLIGDSREITQWETEGYLIRKYAITGGGPATKRYAAYRVTVADPKWKWGSNGPIGLKLTGLGPRRRTLAEAKADIDAAGPSDSGFHYVASPLYTIPGRRTNK